MAFILTFFGQESRRANDSIESLVVQGEPRAPEPAENGPCRMRWVDQIKATVGSPLHECIREFRV
ncbi:jg26011 [Pararge aegeria aegeria]|uniref:Jg26011 protein n=1 Tax=Pararge aegeria aegeria TaxID=348720 RepID=A0A8S4RZL3_9NEOP|nr:jg26011 [Pararge aegeria aegeria]